MIGQRKQARSYSEDDSLILSIIHTVKHEKKRIIDTEKYNGKIRLVGEAINQLLNNHRLKRRKLCIIGAITIGNENFQEQITDLMNDLCVDYLDQCIIYWPYKSTRTKEDLEKRSKIIDILEEYSNTLIIKKVTHRVLRSTKVEESILPRKYKAQSHSLNNLSSDFFFRENSNATTNEIMCFRMSHTIMTR